MDKKALLDELKIDRAADAPSPHRPLKWLLLIALAGGLAFVGFVVEFPGAEPLSVRTVVARSPTAGAAASVLDATGYVVARRQATVSAKVTGKVSAVYVEEGMAVTEGQLLARLDDSIPRAELALGQSRLAASRAALTELEVAREQAVLDLDRTRELAERKLASQADLDRNRLVFESVEAQLARAASDVDVAQRSLDIQHQIVADMEIRAPFAGIVVAKAAQPGEMISPISAGGGFTRTGICSIVDMDSLEVEVDVNEAYINRVSAVQPVTVTLNAYPDFRIPAAVIAIIPTADRNKATVRVRIRLLERDARVLPDMGVRVAFLEEEAPHDVQPSEPGVVLPARAAAEDAEGTFVYVVDGEHARRRAVVLGERTHDSVQVLTGVAAGERIVAEIGADISDGVRVQNPAK